MEASLHPLTTYADAHLHYQRINSMEVSIGDVPLGGKNPIRVQSMTTTDTMDTKGTVEQTLRLARAGCEYVRITAPSKKEAQNLAEIKKQLKLQACDVPLIADIHFTPNAAEVAARIVEKVRVNPGNYADKKRFQNLEYTDASYQAEIDRIYTRFSPLVKICKEYGTAMRIGTNHGSLSDRILSRYGDTPLGMVESAMEFIRICESHNFYNIVISMKASNPQVMVQAYRLLMETMKKNGRIYPLHLGVTEAGEGEDGRIKSALGIATLLMDGIGDTVRVSLTEEPEYEAPVAQYLIDHFVKQAENQDTSAQGMHALPSPLPHDPYAFKRRSTHQVLNVGGDQVPRVIADLSHQCKAPADLGAIGYTYVPALDKYNFSDISADFVYVGTQTPVYELPGGLWPVRDYRAWKLIRPEKQGAPYFDSAAAFLEADKVSDKINFIRIDREQLPHLLGKKGEFTTCVFVLESNAAIQAYEWRDMVYALTHQGFDNPFVLKLKVADTHSFYQDEELADHLQLPEDARTQLYMSSEASTLLVDGLIDGLWLDAADNVRLRTAFGMLQLARMRMTKTEYISCPSCGRTLFDLQETTAKIRVRTEHLKGVKIGIMGCIVNGPGEMADADYGYVGMGPGKIALYRGQEVVERSVPAEQAVDALIELIREDDKWIEPEEKN
ncbi:MAG: (E)-4-hydroxy-3-methylbut-2-enyl-diphosphate synthase [Bacteroidota bacterium]